MLRNIQLLSPKRSIQLNEGKSEKVALTGAPAAIITQDVKGALPKGLGGHDVGDSKYVLRIRDLPEKYRMLSKDDAALLKELLTELNDNSEYKIASIRQFSVITIRATLKKVPRHSMREVTVNPELGEHLIMFLEGKDLTLGSATTPGNIEALHVKKIIQPVNLIPLQLKSYGLN